MARPKSWAFAASESRPGEVLTVRTDGFNQDRSQVCTFTRAVLLPMRERKDLVMAAAALEGVRVVELATVVAGPGAGRYLADFGAEVIKVEAPGGDATRRMGWAGPGETDLYFWKLVNRNKQAVSLDLKSTDGRRRYSWSLLADAVRAHREHAAGQARGPRLRPGRVAQARTPAGDPPRQRLRPGRALRAASRLCDDRRGAERLLRPARRGGRPTAAAAHRRDG